MKKNKYIFSDQEIQLELVKAKELKQQGIIQESVLQDYWCKEKSKKSKVLNLILAIFLGFLGLDRFYLKKIISGCVKFVFVTIFPLILILIWTLTSFYKNSPVDLIMYSVIVFGIQAGFYFGDIIIGLFKPRDKEMRCL